MTEPRVARAFVLGVLMAFTVGYAMQVMPSARTYSVGHRLVIIEHAFARICQDVELRADSATKAALDQIDPIGVAEFARLGLYHAQGIQRDLNAGALYEYPKTPGLTRQRRDSICPEGEQP